MIDLLHDLERALASYQAGARMHRGRMGARVDITEQVKAELTAEIASLNEAMLSGSN